MAIPRRSWLHRLRMLGEMCELRDHDLYFSQAETHELLANFGVEVSAADLALLHEPALAARDIQEPAQFGGEWNVLLSMILLRAYSWLEDFPAVDREAAAALAVQALTEPVKLVLVPGAQALAWFESGHLAQAADAAAAADRDATRLGFGQHVFALDCLRALAGLALERRDLDTAERLTDRALAISGRRWPALEFQALLDRAAIWAARGHVHQALATVEAARTVLAGTRSLLLARADELEGLLRLSLGDERSPAELAHGLAAAPGSLLLARIALASGDHRTAQQHLQSPSLSDLRPRRSLVRQLLLAVGAMERDDAMTAGILGGALQTASEGGFVDTVVTTDPRLASYLIEHSRQLRNDAFMEQLVRAAMAVRAARPDAIRPGRLLNEQLTPAELRVLKLLPTSTYPQIAATLFISLGTVKPISGRSTTSSGRQHARRPSSGRSVFACFKGVIDIPVGGRPTIACAGAKQRVGIGVEQRRVACSLIHGGGPLTSSGLEVSEWALVAGTGGGG